MDYEDSDKGFWKAMIIGFLTYLSFIGYNLARTGELPLAERAGELFTYCMLPAAIAGWVVNRRHWSWLLICAVYLAFWAATMLLVVLR